MNDQQQRIKDLEEKNKELQALVKTKNDKLTSEQLDIFLSWAMANGYVGMTEEKKGMIIKHYLETIIKR